MISPEKRERLNANARRYRSRNREKCNEASLKHYHRNKEKCNKRSLEWAKNNPERLKELKKKANANWYRKPEVMERQKELSKLKYQEKKARGWKPKPKDPEYNAEYYQKNKKVIYKKQCKWVKKNREKVNGYAKSHFHKIRENLSDSYLKGNLKKCGFNIVTPQMIEIRREVTKIRRFIKNIHYVETSNSSN